MTLTEYLAENELKAAELAERVGVSRQVMSRYIRGERRPDWLIMRKIAEATGGKVTANDFMPRAEAEAAQ